MAGDDQIIGNLGVRGSASFGTSTQAFTGLFAVRLSTYAPSSVPANSGLLDKVPSTSYTFSTNDLILGLTLPSTGGQSAGVGLLGLSPTSSGGVGIQWNNASAAPISPSTGIYIVTVLRTT